MDYSLYSKFWQIQDFFRYIYKSSFLHLIIVRFRNPAQCYQKVPWKQFSMYAADVLSTFQVNITTVNIQISLTNLIVKNLQSFKLDPTSGKSTVVGDQEAEHYFAK